jgi:hypothetical protein
MIPYDEISTVLFFLILEFHVTCDMIDSGHCNHGKDHDIHYGNWYFVRRGFFGDWWWLYHKDTEIILLYLTIRKDVQIKENLYYGHDSIKKKYLLFTPLIWKIWTNQKNKDLQSYTTCYVFFIFWWLTKKIRTVWLKKVAKLRKKLGDRYI